MLQAVLPEPPAGTLSTWAQCTAGIAFANVAGFVIVVAPAGLGVREYLLRMLLSSFGPAPYIAASAILLRLDWIVAEAFFAAWYLLAQARDFMSLKRKRRIACPSLTLQALTDWPTP